MARQDDARSGGADDAPRALPLGVDDLSAQWFTDVLAGGRAGAGSVVGVAATRIGTSHGLLGALWHVALTWAGGDGPAAVVVKLPAEGAGSRAVATAMAMYPREVRFYDQLGPDTPVAVRCLHATVDDRTHDFALVLEDLTGATVVDQLRGCPPDCAEAVVEALAELHARHWDENGLDEAGWLEPFARSVLAHRIVDAVRQLWPDVRERWSDELVPEVAIIGDDMADRVHTAADAVSRPPMTLTHGDVRVDNIFFEQGTVRMCDWQLTGRARAARDVAYFLTQSLSRAVRAEHEEQLVQTYLTHLRRLGVDAGDETTFRDDYRHAAVIGFAYGIVAAGGLDQPDDRAAAIPRSMLRRSAQAMLDLGCLDRP
jgi:aminoglycoside phosphotransferase (APT) family kinase protein